MSRRRFSIEPLELRATPSVLLADSFASLAFDPAHWDTATLANVAPSSAAATAPYAARFNGNAAGGDVLRSVAFPLAGATSATLAYSFARTAARSRPAPGEDLVIEVRTDGGTWMEVARHAATDPDMATTARRTLAVPIPAGAATLQIRFRHLGTRPQLGDYLLDDVSLVTGSAEVSGRLWFDRDANAQPDAAELPLAGWTVYADTNRNETFDVAEPHATTDATGAYTITDLPPGDYAVRPDMPVGWFATGPQRSHFALSDSVDAGDAAALTGARAIIASNDGRFLYAAGSGAGAIAVVARDSGGNLAVVQAAASGATNGAQVAAFDALALSPDGRSLYAVSGDADALMRFDRDGASGQLTWRDSLRAAELAGPFDFPAAVAIGGDGLRVYVATSNSESIVVFDRDAITGELAYTESFTLPQAGLGGASALALSPDGRHLYVAASGDRALSAFASDPVTGRLSHIETLLDDTARANGLDGASAVAVSPDGRFVVAAGGFDDALAIFARDAATGRLEFRDLVANGEFGVASLDGPQSVAFSADGNGLFAAAINSDAISAFRVDSLAGSLTPITVLGGSSLAPLDGVRALAPLPDGSLAAAAFHSDRVASFVSDGAQANLRLFSNDVLATVDFGLARDAASWSGAGGNAFWSTAANWHGNLPPQPGEKVAIGEASSGPIDSINDLDASLSISGLSLNGAGVVLTGTTLNLASGDISAEGGPHFVGVGLNFAGPANIATSTSGDASSSQFFVEGAINGESITIHGTGSTHLRGTVMLSGTLRVASGTLQADGTFDVAGVVVDPQATLAGQGLVASPVALAANAALSPGTSPTSPAAGSGASQAASGSAGSPVGMLASGDLALAAGASLVVDVVGNGVTAEHDALTVTGSVSVDGATIGFVLSGQLPIGLEYVVIGNDGDDPVVGEFAGVAEGSYFEIAGQRFRLSYAGGDGNDVTIYAPPTGEVLGRLWHDINANRTIDEGEGPLAGWTVFADVNSNGRLDAGEPTAITDGEGNYRLALVPVGRTRILPLLPNGWQATTPAPLADFIDHVETVSAGPSGAAPHLDGVRGVALSPDGRSLYAVSNNDDALVALRRDTSTGRITYVGEQRDGSGDVNGLNGARGVAISRDGRNVYVAGYFDDAVAVFARDPATGDVTFVEAKLDNTLGTDGLDGATAIAVSPDDRHVYVTGYLDDAVAIFACDAATGTLTFAGRVRDGVAGVNGLDGAHGIAVSPDGKHVYVAGANDNAVAIFRRDIATGGLEFVEALIDGQNGIATLGVARAVAVSPDGRFVFAVAELDNAVTTFRRDAATGRLTLAATARNGVNVAAGLGGATAVATSPDGERIYVASAGDDAVAAFDVDRATGALVYREHLTFPTTAGLDGAAAIALSPDGDHVYVAGPNSDAIAVVSRKLPADVVVLAPGEVVVGIDHGAVNPSPTVVAIAARSSSWSSSFLSQINDDSQLVAGLVLDADGVTFSAHGGVDEFAVRFSEDVVPTLDDLVAFGVARDLYRAVQLTYDPATFTAVWRIEQPVDADKLLVRVLGTIEDAGGASLGADVTRRLDVLAGSIDGATVAEPDLARVLAAIFARVGSPKYAAAIDRNGDGAITYLDAILARNSVGRSLPSGEPTESEVLPMAYAPPPVLVVAKPPRSTPVGHAAPPPLVVSVGPRETISHAAPPALVVAASGRPASPAAIVAAARANAADRALDELADDSVDDLSAQADLAPLRTARVARLRRAMR